jgi:RimJ/RimL family protein N-acetyltransferase
MPTAVPEIETPRLLLRGHHMEDFDAHTALWADPVVTRFIGGRPFTREEAWVRFLRHAGMWATMGFGFWAVVDKASGRLAGEAGFHELRRDLEPSIEGALEAGWGFAPEMFGRGVATEAMTAILEWRSRNLSGRRVTCLIDPENRASVRVAEKLGFREFARTTYHAAPVALFEL